MSLPQPAHRASAQEKRWFWWITVCALVVLGAGIGLRDPWPSDEPRFTLVAKQMVESGEWLFPHRGSELYSDKPPMLMWLEAIFYQLTGNWRVAFLLPSLLAGLGTLALTYDLGRRLWNPRVGLFAAGLLLATFQFVYQVKRAQIDPLVMFLITLGNWGLLLHLLRGPNWRAYWLGCFAAGLGVITKGVGVIALLMLLPYLLARRRQWPGLVVTSASASGWRWAGGALAFFGAIALWLVPMAVAATLRGTPEYLAYMNDILFHQTAKRYGGSVGGHAQPYWYFVPVLLFHFFPLSLVYASAARDWYRGLRQADARLLLLLSWCALVFVFFSIAGGKREVYLMPMLPLLAVALAPTVQRIVGAPWLRGLALACAVLAGCALVAAGAWALQGQWTSMNTMAAERELADGGRWLWTMMLCMGALFLVCAAVGRLRHGVQALLAGMASFWLVWGVWASVLLNDANSAAGVMRRAGQIAGPTAQIGMVAWKEQNLLMADRKMQDFGFRTPTSVQFAAATRWQAQQPEERWIFSLREAVSACVDKDKVTIAGYSNRRQWWMFRSDAVLANCVPEFDAREKKTDSEEETN
ncbi:MAG: glycosyltransferase family 39 protein [Rhodoferax sp.]|nr:glycosyltransferase family 39 protein [Rhodoferax sp.]